jgi:glutaconyl-CoA/methylmalonyl-CoA decarboxylase subunit gamma
MMKIKVKVEEEIFEVEINDLQARPILAFVNGECIEVWPEDVSTTPVPVILPRPVEKLVPAPTSPAAPAAPRPPAASIENIDKAKAVTAPIPGVIQKVTVCEGATVETGQELIVLEAMKMKNIIRAPRPGKIGAVLVVAGDHVKHGQVLLTYAD